MKTSTPLHHPGSHSPKPLHRHDGPNPNNVYCTPCIQRLLRPQLKKHASAIAERNRVRDWCSSQLDESRL